MDCGAVTGLFDHFLVNLYALPIFTGHCTGDLEFRHKDTSWES
jgi:hypothetical protein